MKIRISELLPPAHILWRLDCQSKKRVFERVGILFENVGALPRDELFAQLLARERLGSTAVGNSGAIPHVRMKNLQKPLCALVRLAAPIPYDAQDDGAVQTLFFLIAPEKTNETHLCLLAVFSEMLTDETLMQRFAAAEDAEAAGRCIAAWEAERRESLDEIFAQSE